MSNKYIGQKKNKVCHKLSDITPFFESIKSAKMHFSLQAKRSEPSISKVFFDYQVSVESENLYVNKLYAALDTNLLEIS